MAKRATEKHEVIARAERDADEKRKRDLAAARVADHAISEATKTGANLWDVAELLRMAYQLDHQQPDTTDMPEQQELGPVIQADGYREAS
jgi:hypothetical protein